MPGHLTSKEAGKDSQARPRVAQLAEHRDGGTGNPGLHARATGAYGKAQGVSIGVAPQEHSPSTSRRPEVRVLTTRISWPTITWGEVLGRSSAPYLKRWVVDFGAFSVRLHHWIRSDDLRHPHDHAWDFVSVLVAGELVDRTPGPTGGYVDGEPASWTDTPRQRWVPEFFRAEHRHSVVAGRGGAWTIMLTGHARREWGFWTPKRGGPDKGAVRLRRRNKYFREHGHH